MTFKVHGHRLLIKPTPVEETTSGGIVIARPDKGTEREKAATTSGTVLQVGSTCWKAYDAHDPDWKPWCKVGDEVIFAKYQGKLVTDQETKEDYLILNDEDIFLTVEKG